jgi:exodeoxyribonuclease VII small subunit
MARKEEGQPGFEAALKRLEEIVARMESGEADLDAMLALFEEGQRLVKVCTAKLNEVEKKIEQIAENGAGGVTVSPLELAAE